MGSNIDRLTEADLFDRGDTTLPITPLPRGVLVEEAAIVQSGSGSALSISGRRPVISSGGLQNVDLGEALSSYSRPLARRADQLPAWLRADELGAQTVC